MYTERHDFSGEIGALAEALLSYAGSRGVYYVGDFQGFEVFTRHGAVWLTKPGFRGPDVGALSFYLYRNDWSFVESSGIIEHVDRPERDGKVYLNVLAPRHSIENLTQRLEELSPLLERYNSARV